MPIKQKEKVSFIKNYFWKWKEKYNVKTECSLICNKISNDPYLTNYICLIIKPFIIKQGNVWKIKYFLLIFL